MARPSLRAHAACHPAPDGLQPADVHRPRCALLHRVDPLQAEAVGKEVMDVRRREGLRKVRARAACAVGDTVQAGGRILREEYQKVSLENILEVKFESQS
jgi:hypothetical protein